jgi:hypothetical protein
MVGLPARALRRVADLLAMDLDHEFELGRDPYGDPWAPLSDVTLASGRTPPPLTDTRNMRDSVKVRPKSPSDILITIDHPAMPHQTGWNGKSGKGPARPMVPNRDEVPANWAHSIESAVEAEFRRPL